MEKKSKKKSSMAERIVKRAVDSSTSSDVVIAMKKLIPGQKVKLPTGDTVTVTDVSMTKRGQMFWFELDGDTKWMFTSELR